MRMSPATLLTVSEEHTEDAVTVRQQQYQSEGLTRRLRDGFGVHTTDEPRERPHQFAR